MVGASQPACEAQAEQAPGESPESSATQSGKAALGETGNLYAQQHQIGTH